MGKKLKIIAVSLCLFAAFMLFGMAQDEYSITYDFGSAAIMANEIVNNNPNSYTSGTETPLTAPACTGFVFDGWYAESDHLTKMDKLSAETTGDITVYAKWYEERYNITYVLSTPGVEISADMVENFNATSHLTRESVYLTAPSCPDSAYIFDGWYFDSERTLKAEYISEYTCEDITLYAKWSNAVYSIHYDLGDITSSTYPTANGNPTTYEYNTTLTLKAPESQDPSFTFDGWFTDEFFTQPITKIEKGSSGDIILYAKWTKAAYNIHYVLSTDHTFPVGNVSNTNPTIRTAGQEVVLSAPVSDNKNIAFDGWFTSPDYKESSRITVIQSTVSESTMVYAKWREAVYQINYDYGSLNLLMRPIENTNPTSYRFGDETVLAPVEADGFIFNGWCTDKALKNKTDSIPQGAYGDITLYADFTEKTYTVKYVVTYKDIVESRVVNTNETIRTTTQAITLTNAKLVGINDYEFGGWYLDSDFTQRVYDIRSYTTENVTVYAKWISIVTYLPVWGDATLSSKLTAADARLILRYSAKLEPEFTEMQLKVSDLNNDAAVNATDARLALRLSANLETEEGLIAKYNLPTIELVDGEVVFTKK